MSVPFLQTSWRLRGVLVGLGVVLGSAAAALVLVAAGALHPAPALVPATCALAGLAATAAAGLRAAHVERERRAWALVTAALAVASAWFAARATLPGAVADGLRLAFYPAFGAGLLLLLRRAFVRAPLSVRLDGVLAVCATGALGVAVAYAPADAAGGVDAHGVPWLFPLGDLLAFVAVLGVLAMAAWRADPRWATIGLGLILWFVADTLHLAGDARGAADALPWALGFAAFAAAAWQDPRGGEDPAPAPGVHRLLLLPAAFAAGALVLLCVDRLIPLDDAAVTLALVAVAVGLGRTTLTLHEAQMLAAARHESLTDELTRLPSRRHFHRRLEQTIAEATSEGVAFGLLLFDLDRFKELNDTLGHGAGDQLLIQVGRRLTACMPRGALVARLGGDEFAVLLAPGSDREAAGAAGATIIDALGRPFDIEGLELDIGASVGVAVFGEDADAGEELLRRADVAMYLAKGAGGGVAEYDPERDLHTRDRLALGRQLREGLARGELHVWYQPKADPQLGRVLGVEALVRWEHPAHGLLMPPDFLPVASRSGLMPEVTRLVLGAALDQLAGWRREGLDLTVAVNLAVSDLLDPDLPAAVAALLAEHDVPPTGLALEITEHGLIADPTGAADTLDRIAALGVRIALDDFGTGWSSLAQLRRLPVDELKIDRSFVRGMAGDDEDAAIIRTTLDLARSLRLRVVAEGVEDDETWVALADLGCDAIQGYALSRPLPGPQFGAWLAARREGSIARCRTPAQRPARTTPARFRL